MLYKVGVSLFVAAVSLSLHPPQAAGTGNRAPDLQEGQNHENTIGQSAPALLVLQDPVLAGEQQKSDQPQKKPPETKKGGKTSPRQGDKKPSPKGFVPSEKIKADKAVDFPADI